MAHAALVAAGRPFSRRLGSRGGASVKKSFPQNTRLLREFNLGVMESHRLFGGENDKENNSEDTEEVLLAVRFRSQSAEGRILSTTFLRQDGHIEAEVIRITIK